MGAIFHIALLLSLTPLIVSASVEPEDPINADSLSKTEPGGGGIKPGSDKERLERLIIEARFLITKLQEELAHQEHLFLKLHGVLPVGGVTRRTAAASFESSWTGGSACLAL